MSSTIGKTRLAGALAAALLVGSTGAMAQTRTLAAQDYAQAERFMIYNTLPLVDHDVQRVKWLDNTHFWYVDHDASGDRVMEMNTVSGKAAPAFDQAKLAAALGKVTGKPMPANKVPPFGFDFSVQKDGRYDVAVMGKHYVCDLGGAGDCTAKAVAKTGNEPGIVSPDKTKEAFIRDWNLWVRDLATGKETQLTTDGVKDFGYATDNAGWIHTDRAVVDWSPDSKRIATYQQDQRGVGEMYTVSTKVGHPELDAWKYPLPGDKKVFMIEPVVVDVDTHKVVRLQLPPQQRLSTLDDDLSYNSDGHWDDLQWAPDSKTLAMVNSSRDRKQAWYRVVNADTGAVRTAFDEKVATYYSSGMDHVNWRYLPDSHEAIWPSERSDWQNLYLYDINTGKELHSITTGDGNVIDVLHLDRKSRELWFIGTGRVAGVDPYFKQFWKVGVDGGKPVLLTPEDADHTISMSPDGKTFVDSYSTVDTAPVTVLRSSDDGHVIATIAKADLSRLKAAGWVAPIPFTVKARDGKTELYGQMFKPSHFDPSKKYPIIDYVYPGPQTGSVRTRSFLPAQGDNQALAELGFIVIALDGMGTPWRSASFHHTWYGQMGDNTLPDQVAGIKELAQRYPWIDINRVGIWGHSGGGNTTADAMFRYPDFFKVGWAESGNHDNRNYENDWGEKYQGLLTTDKDGSTSYDNQANQLMAKNLKGRLMLVHGTIDDNVPVGETFLVADALIKANKDFDMLIIPNVHHGYAAATPYATRRRWDYFVQYLAGDTPPKEYELKKWPWF
ncbi:DPP IV N-terminal domain-containing protein [Rhodanobacter sp. 7MK24]|uniref:S9 family peptidase n=1 Tax=Rhodanobacter sp. 7MK24 TaxID=2775922 RepID=UPI0017865195|nr:S9 family peptidase [Rhodanobacter sp. 7MK24]MBD8880016.1 DPP IV N-terminal domain-containing protein [Rhodanobacter sp. 7MK24]